MAVLDKWVDPLHVGRKFRTATPKMRKALAERDRRCAWPGCPDPPDWCQGHHERPWALGGATEVDGMALLCGDHHRKLDRGWRLERLPDRRLMVHPPGRLREVRDLTMHGPHSPPA
jgi:hypothetical protein